MSEIQQSNLEQITAEILVYKQQTAVNIIEIGRRLIQAKEVLPHGSWGKWLEEQVEFSHPTANRFMQAAREFGNSSSVRNLNPTKIYALLDIPVNQREEFTKTHDIETMSTRQLQESAKKIKEAEEARKAAEKTAAEAKAEVARLTEDYETLRQENKKIFKPVKPEVIEKTVEVVPQEVEDELSRLKTENLKLQKKNSQLESRLCISEMDPAERLKKARVSQKVLDEELLWLDGRIKIFLKEVAPYVFVADSFMNMKEHQVKDYVDVLGKLESWLNIMKQALPYGGEVIDIGSEKGVITVG